jgi:hypothetical protein
MGQGIIGARGYDIIRARSMNPVEEGLIQTIDRRIPEWFLIRHK